ncbi:MAG: hypothetical protein V3U49_05620 [Nitrososphaerales archaeon]
MIAGATDKLESESFSEAERRRIENLERENKEFRDDRAYDRKDRDNMRKIFSELVSTIKKKEDVIEQYNARGTLPYQLIITIVKGSGGTLCLRLMDVDSDSERAKSKMGGAWFLQLAWMKNIIDGSYRGVTYFNFSAFDREKMGRFR